MNLNPVLIIQNIFNGLMVGGLYALIAVGYTMVYGILRLINFAHGDIMTMGIYFAFYAVVLMKMPFFVGVIFSVFATALLGFLIDRIAYKPLRNAPRISALITAIGMSFFLESFAVVFFGSNYKSFMKVLGKNSSVIFKTYKVGKIIIPQISFIVIGITILALLILFYIVYKTKIGMAMRAISTDIPTTALMGINVDMVIGFTFALGSALAAIAGIMWAMRYPNFYPYTGFNPGLKAFIAAVFGGIGSLQGAVLGGFLLGLIEVMLITLFPSVMQYKDAFAFLILIVILVIKPSGLLGKRSIVKV
ncbi:amino acid/amide ABC transporter membrane protein 1, HAAT family [Thermosipho atlanticus DSM 15807]|uniref:Amino acid/amide ABC transporter membrane protein 1, HAAT family n=2 Tax=Thermosipho TaxID=2420 RepID=A0A1M5QRV6_9BACT|nr:branched-chain amino acid ABC transporter permease [Thermosipho atlanticus]SHH16854.1 amino acid/amide ABC transporter membrane protein 1, HAAT family [Thermosipho atlanticus DSM 15807]